MRSMGRGGFGGGYGGFGPMMQMGGGLGMGMRMTQPRFGAPPSSMQMPDISSDTSSQEPEVLKCRIFVGNVDTRIVRREVLYRLFSRFGQVKAISTHKGFAFVQYTTEAEARAAVIGSDGKILAQAKIDGEPEALYCVVCNQQFKQAWPLMTHVGEAHDMVVYKLTADI